ncbi:hypothetical protein V6Z11_A01G027900 [Gossypium hirsutum]
MGWSPVRSPDLLRRWRRRVRWPESRKGIGMGGGAGDHGRRQKALGAAHLGFGNFVVYLLGFGPHCFGL